MVLLLAGFQLVYADQLTFSKGLPKQQPIGILQYERIGAPDSNVSVLSARNQNNAVLTHIGVADSNNHLMIGTPDSRYLTMSVLNTQRSLPDFKLESGEEQGPSK
jgi:molybdopterin-binding protein